MAIAKIINPNPAITLADFTCPGLIVSQLSGRNTAEVLEELSQALARERRVPEQLPFYREALKRESLMGSDWEAGIAFPHARLPNLNELSFALGRGDQPLAWGEKAVRSVRLVFLIAIPSAQPEQYLSLISGLARLSKTPRLAERLHAARDNFEILEVLQQITLRTQPIPDLVNKTINPAK